MKRTCLILALILLAASGLASERKALVLFVQFQDLKFKYGYEEFSAMTDSLGMYFNDQFHGEPVFSFRRGPLVTIEESHAIYGANGTAGADVQMYKAVAQACSIAADSLSFADFLSYPSTEIRDLLIVVPGKSEQDSLDTEMFSPQFVTMKGNYYAGRYRIACYGLACELDAGGSFAGIGTIAHEYCHILGLSDLYDTDGEGSGGVSKGLWGSLGIMDGGNANGGGHCPPNFCAADYYDLGAGKGEIIRNPGNYTLEPIDVQGRYFIFEGPRSGEAFLVESRIDRGWDSHIGGRGMVIYHYDRSDGNALWSTWDGRELTARERWDLNRVNCNPEHQCVELQAPDPSSPFFPHGDIESFASETDPAFRFWDGNTSHLAISGITQDGEGNISFSLIRPIAALTVTPFQNSLIISWKCDQSISGIDSCKVVCSRGSERLSTGKGTLLGNGLWSCTIDKLSPATTYRVAVQIMKNGSPFFSAGISASTMTMRRGTFPFIYLKGAQRNSDGSFAPGARIPLQVFNADKAQEIKWYFNGEGIATGPDGYYTIPGSGTLRAEILLEDGSRDYIIKEIEVK